MKLRILNIISCLFVATCIITSCLDEEVVEYEASSNSSITAFSISDIETQYNAVIDGKDTILIDTVIGTDYPFTIDQQAGLIYNEDSLPIGTDISKVVVDITADTYGIYIVASTDSLWEDTDSLDFSSPIQFKVLSETGVFGRTYVAKINVHKQVPDSMVWTKINSNFSPEIQAQKAVFANNNIYVFAEQTSQVAVTSFNIQTNEWTTLQTIDIPTKADYSSVMIWGNKFFILAENKLYTSENGINWTLVETEQTFGQLTANVHLTSYQKLIATNQDNQYIESKDGINWDTYETIPEGFPTKNISFASFPLTTNPSLSRTIVMGENKDSESPSNLAWTQLGSEHDWTALSIEANQYYCPNLENPTMIYYNNQLYAFGGPAKNNTDIKAFSRFYSSIDDGITWEEKTENVMFPSEFTDLYKQANGHYSWAIDQDNHLWIMWSQTGEVWRGRINKLGFDKK